MGEIGFCLKVYWGSERFPNTNKFYSKMARKVVKNKREQQVQLSNPKKVKKRRFTRYSHPMQRQRT